MSSVRSHWVGRNPSGMFIVEVKAQYLTLLRTNLGVSRGLCAMEDLEAPQWFVVLPHQCDLRVEIERLLLCLPQSAKISLMHGGSHKSLMDRTDLGIGIQVDDAFFLQYARQEVLATWSGGNSILPATTDIAPKVGCFIVLGVEGEGGRRALVPFLWDMLKVECKVTYDMRSVDRLSMAAVEYPFSQEAERAVHELTRVATVVKVESVYEETDKTYSMQFCTDAAHAMYRNGASVVREEGGGTQQIALVQGQVQGMQRDLQQFIQASATALRDQQQAGAGYQAQITQMQTERANSVQACGLPLPIATPALPAPLLASPHAAATLQPEKRVKFGAAQSGADLQQRLGVPKPPLPAPAPAPAAGPQEPGPSASFSGPPNADKVLSLEAQMAELQRQYALALAEQAAVDLSGQADASEPAVDAMADDATIESRTPSQPASPVDLAKRNPQSRHFAQPQSLATKLGGAGLSRPRLASCVCLVPLVALWFGCTSWRASSPPPTPPPTLTRAYLP